MRLLYILGRQPAIGLAELESLYTAEAITPLSKEGALVTTEDRVDFSRIGGAVKEAVLQESISSSDWRTIELTLKKLITTHTQDAPYTKLTLGLSVYGENIATKKLLALGLTLKKTIKQQGLSGRLVPNPEPALNSAQVYHNKLTNDNGIEIIIYRDGKTTHIAFTKSVQNIDSYTLRDRGRPKRDSRVGMLPPKLAQTIINLATSGSKLSPQDVLLDPFCGTGVLLQEAMLAGRSVYGTDIEERMVRYSRDNLNWLQEKFSIRAPWYLHEADATHAAWRQPVSTVACETYLGRPFTHEPDKEILFKNRNDCDTIIRKFLENIHTQLKSGDRLCLGVPAWFAHGTTYHLKTLDYLEEIGYNRISFVHAEAKDLIYHREGQIVGRELVVITRK